MMSELFNEQIDLPLERVSFLDQMGPFLLQAFDRLLERLDVLHTPFPEGLLC